MKSKTIKFPSDSPTSMKADSVWVDNMIDQPGYGHHVVQRDTGQRCHYCHQPVLPQQPTLDTRKGFVHLECQNRHDGGWAIADLIIMTGLIALCACLTRGK